MAVYRSDICDPISLPAHKHRLLDYLNPSLWSLDASHLDTCQCLIQLLGYWSHLIHTAWQADFLTMINNLSNWRASRVILAGDHCQLPPTVKSIAALRAGLGKTLMERIAENKPEVVTLLKIQYRMNDEIMRFSSDWFYGGKVESAPQIKYRSVLDYDHPITWIDTSNEENQITIEGEDAPEDSASTSSSVSAANQNSDLNFKEQFVGESFGRINKAEAELTLLTLAEYFTKISKRRVLEERIDVGIISPYRAQVQYLKKLIKKYEFFKPYRRLISVNTVDGFQGQERDVILISLVRSNDEGQIGFLKDLRRMNVAMTRARMKLIILGNKDTMTKHPFYKKLWEYVEAINNNE